MNSTTTNSSLTNDLPRCKHRFANGKRCSPWRPAAPARVTKDGSLRYTNSLPMTTTTTLDLHWTGRPRSIASVLLESDGHRALLDPGPSSTLSTLREQLRASGLSVQDLDTILLTHIHLDHAGATGSLVRENPRLAVYVHERGAQHMADPTKLLSSAVRLYAAALERLFGEFLPVPQENLRVLRGGETLTLGARKLEVFYTPGHASHHVSYFDPSEGTAYVGDTAGISVEGNSFILPATPPPDIDLEIWNASLDAIAERRPARLFLTHFGISNDPAGHIARYRERLQTWGALVQKLLSKGADDATASRLFVESITGEITGTLSEAAADHYIFNGGLSLSWQGLARYYRKRAAAQA
ncbi:MAG TPA: MBL fold metallo-hydrolase [Candidatus Acidoferrum sp.]|nr:MBL fold metallo-hydrolase [Candidatus Acidoferrum sp.]